MSKWFLVHQRIAGAVWMLNGELISGREVEDSKRGRKYGREEVVDYYHVENHKQGREKVRRASGMVCATRTPYKAPRALRKCGYGHGPVRKLLDPDADVGFMNLALVERNPDKIWANIKGGFCCEARR